MDGPGTLVFEDCNLILVVTSTYGKGEIPDYGLAPFTEVAKGIDLVDRETRSSLCATAPITTRFVQRAIAGTRR